MGLSPQVARVRRTGRVFRAATLILAVIATAALATACGGGDDAVTDSEKAADVEILNAAIAQELTLIDAYANGFSLLEERSVPIAQQLRGHAQEHLNSMTKAIRGLGGEVEAEEGSESEEDSEGEEGSESELDYSALQSEADFLTLAYELESAALASYLEAAPNLETTAPRRLAASIAASKAQHLVILRQRLGTDLAASFPEPFDSGDVLPPSAPAGGASPPEAPAPPSEDPAPGGAG